MARMTPQQQTMQEFRQRMQTSGLSQREITAAAWETMMRARLDAQGLSGLVEATPTETISAELARRKG